MNTIKKYSLLLISLFGLSSCTISTPFRYVDEAERDITEKHDSLLVVITYAKTGKDGDKNNAFWDNVSKVYDSMDSQSGLVGYSIRRELFGDQAWTMTVWREEESLKKFVSGAVHLKAMREGTGALADMLFARKRIAVSEIPISWEAAESILVEKGRGH
ncbi:MAG: hypothetical protein AAFP70_18335 [Calditrichota bacterium]